MCYDCWKEFKGWCKAFTRTEVLLAILEAILLIIFVAFLIFLIMHLIVCSSCPKNVEPYHTTKSVEQDLHPDPNQTTEKATELPHTTLDPSVKCTWEPSKKTDAATNYYESGHTKTTEETIVVLNNNNSKLKSSHPTNTTAGPESYSSNLFEGLVGQNVDSMAYDEQSDGEEANNEYKSAVLALVKLRPPRDVTFGCAVTVVSEHWTVTAASCVEAIEEVDSLDNFVLMERYGEARTGRTHSLADVQLHPLYQGANRSYDLAALRSEDSLRPAATPLALPTLVDHFLVTIGERFSILGFGSFRTVDGAGAERGVRSVAVYWLAGGACAGGAGAGARDAWAPRHLARGQQDARAAGGCGATDICAGVRYARGQPCTYCAGTPLVRARTLLGVMAAQRACAVSCEPARYASLASSRDWLDMVLDLDH